MFFTLIQSASREQSATPALVDRSHRPQARRRARGLQQRHMAPDVPREVPKEVRLFTWARPQVSLYCLAQCALYALLGIFFPETQQASVMVIIGHLLLLASRECVACLADQTLARELYSYCWVAVYALVDGALWLVNRRSQLITGLPAEGMIGIFVLAMLQGVYMRAFGLHEWARLAATACSVVLFTALPAPWSEIGQPWEALGLVCAHTVGELILFAQSLAWGTPSQGTASTSSSPCPSCPSSPTTTSSSSGSQNSQVGTATGMDSHLRRRGGER